MAIAVASTTISLLAMEPPLVFLTIAPSRNRRFLDRHYLYCIPHSSIRSKAFLKFFFSRTKRKPDVAFPCGAETASSTVSPLLRKEPLRLRSTELNPGNPILGTRK